MKVNTHVPSRSVASGQHKIPNYLLSLEAFSNVSSGTCTKVNKFRHLGVQKNDTLNIFPNFFWILPQCAPPQFAAPHVPRHPQGRSVSRQPPGCALLFSTFVLCIYPT